MAVRKILRIGNPLLRETSEDVLESEVGTKEFKKLIRDMFETMRFAEGVGLAAPQIGIMKKIVVVGSEEDNGRYKGSPAVPEQVLINPVITPLAPPADGFWEGCLSVPGMRGYVERPAKIKMVWKDESFNTREEVIEGYRAIVMQHECDHLFGVLYVDRLKSTKLFGYNEDIETEGKLLD
jgi:peptide deformylase